MEVDYTPLDHARDALDSLGTWSDVSAWPRAKDDVADVSSTSARRIRLSSLAATHPLATPKASPSAPHRPNLARWTERDDPNFTDLALSRSFSNSVATSSFASLSAKALIETETTDETVGDDEMMSEDEDAKDDEDED